MPAFEHLESRQLFTVAGPINTLLDVVNANDAYYSLREAIADANRATDADTITFASFLTASQPGTITLKNGQLTITSNVTIDGPGASLLSISGGNRSRVFEITSGASVKLSDMTITDGTVAGSANGAGILNAGDLELNDVRVTNNASVNRGGGIYSSTGSLTLVNSTVASNRAKYGGGIYVGTGSGEILRIAGSSIHINIAFAGGQGIGGGIFVNNLANAGATTIVNSTISNNHAAEYSGGIRTATATQLTIVNSTITRNRAGIEEGGIGSAGVNPTTLHNSIVANNFAPQKSDAAGRFSENSSHNLVGSSAATELTDRRDFNIVANNAGLGALENNGGSTLTHALLTTSPARDAGNADIARQFGVTHDQRLSNRLAANGIASGAGKGVDIGAFEYRALGIPDVTVPEDTSNTLVLLDKAFEMIGSASYSITRNSNPELFTAIELGRTSEATLNLKYRPQQSGQSSITVKATDANGAIRELDFIVTVTPANDAPTIQAPTSVSVAKNQEIIFAAGTSSGISIADPDLLSSLSSALSPNIPIQTAAQTSERLYNNQNQDDFSANGWGNRATVLSSYLLGASVKQDLDSFISMSDTDIRASLALIPQYFNENRGTSWQQWTAAGDAIVILDIEGAGHPRDWVKILETSGEQKLKEVFTAYKRRIDLMHQMYPNVALVPWGTNIPTLTSDSINHSFIESTIKVVSLAIQNGVYDNAYAVLATGWQRWASTDAMWRGSAGKAVDNNMRLAVQSAQQSIVRAVEASSGNKGSHLKVVAFNSWQIFNSLTQSQNRWYGSDKNGQLNPEGYFRQIQSIQDLSKGLTVTVGSGKFQVGQISSIISYESVSGATSISLSQFAAQLQTYLQSPSNGLIEVKLQVANGDLTLQATSNLQFSAGDGVADQSMTFKGKLADVNAALNGLKFRPKANFVGPASLNISVSDLGNLGTDEALEVVKNISINLF
jgi:hypothetical protein